MIRLEAIDGICIRNLHLISVLEGLRERTFSPNNPKLQFDWYNRAQIFLLSRCLIKNVQLPDTTDGKARRIDVCEKKKNIFNEV